MSKKKEDINEYRKRVLQGLKQEEEGGTRSRDNKRRQSKAGGDERPWDSTLNRLHFYFNKPTEALILKDKLNEVDENNVGLGLGIEEDDTVPREDEPSEFGKRDIGRDLGKLHETRGLEEWEGDHRQHQD